MADSTLQLCTSPIQGGPMSTMVTTLLQALIASHCALTIPSAWPEDYGPTALVEGLDVYDFVIVGAGTTGSVVASRLSENPNYRVLLLEAGDDPPTESEVPALFFSLQQGPYTTEYETEPNSDACQGTVTGTCMWHVAHIMGGLSSLGHGISFRGNKPKFDEWNLPNWSWQDVIRYYELAENYQSPASNPNGRLIVNDFDMYDTCHISEMIFKGGEELGVRSLSEKVNSNSRVGYGYVQGHLENGQRMSAAKSYLSVVNSRPNIQVIKRAEVTNISFKQGTTVDRVTFVYDDSVEMTVVVEKEVIITAGVLGTPKLLMLSGIGPQDELRALGIPVVRNLPGVGQNLKDQLVVPVLFHVDKSVAKSKTATEKQIDTFYYLTEKYGPLSTIGLMSLLGFINGESTCAYKNCRYPDLNLFHRFAQRNDESLKSWYDIIGLLPTIAQSIEDANKDAHILVTHIGLQNPESTGYIELQSANYLDKVKVFANYLEDEADVENLLKGIEFQMKLEQTNAYKKAKAEIIKLNIPECDQFVFRTEAYWRCYIKYMAHTLYSTGGTAKMGINTDPEAVVDLRLKVRGINGLRIAGKTVFPTTVLGTDASVMVAERLAAFLKQDWL